MARKTQQHVAEICLYGTSMIGFGWLAQTRDGAMLGDGEPKGNRTATECVCIACGQLLRLFGAAGGRPASGSKVRVFAAGGLQYTDVDLRHPGYFGDFKWQPAQPVVISCDAILAAAEWFSPPR